MGRGIARFVTVHVSESPRTSFNVGEIEGGTSVNSIPSSAQMKVDLRSESEPDLAAIEGHLRDAVKAGIDEEMSAARRTRYGRQREFAEFENQCFGRETGGRTAGEFRASRRIACGRRPTRQSFAPGTFLDGCQYSAIAMGIQAISLGAGGRSGGAHTLEEWYDPTGRELGLQRVALTVLSLAGLEP